MASGRQGKGESRTSPRRIDAVERQSKAMELRKKGMAYREIAQELGYGGPSGAHKAVMSALQKTLQEPADELRQLELERLDLAAAAIASKVEDGDLGSIDRWLRISESRRKLLGLDGPARVDVTSGGESLKTTAIDYSELSDDELRTILAQRSGAGAGRQDAGPAESD
jgi:hypothetical protein